MFLLSCILVYVVAQPAASANNAAAPIIMNEICFCFMQLILLFPRYVGSAIKGLKEAKNLARKCPSLIQICDSFAPPAAIDCAPIGKC